VVLAHPSDEKRPCLHTDASDQFWSAVVKQVPPEDLDLPAADQRHEPLVFLSGRFTGTSTRWPVIEKEAFAIIRLCDRMDWLLHCPLVSPFSPTKTT
jgi:RNase H-like domain found in reverse transcriptase